MSTEAKHERDGTVRWLATFAALSLGAHLALVGFAGRSAAPHLEYAARPIELVAVEVQKPIPVLPAPPAKVVPRLIRVPVKQRPTKTVAEKVPDAKPPAPLIIGMTLSSTTTAGGAAVPVGNTLQGRSTGPARPVAESQGAAPPYLPSYQVDSLPSPLDSIRADYPPDVRRDEVEGMVVLSVRINERGEVAEVKVTKSLDWRLDALAVRTLKASRWRAAMVKGQPVATEIKYNFRFELTR